MSNRFLPTREAIDLLHRGQLALSEIEDHGVVVDKAYLESAIDTTTRQIREVEDAMRADPMYRLWHRRYGDKTKLTSPEQLAGVVFGEMGYKPKKATKSGKRASADESSFDGIDLPFVRDYFKAAKLRKGRDTYLEGIRREMVRHDDGTYRVHPSYNLNTVTTFRSSCDNPNFMNVPVRNPGMAEMVRRSYIPRPGNQILEIDYGQIEVRIPCCYHSDPVLMDYVNDDTKDMHRDTAGKLFLLRGDQVSKQARHVAKNQMVFPTFYGSYYAQIAPGVWESIDRQKLVVEGVKKPDGTPLTVREHLTAKGITDLGACDPRERPVAGTFEHHCKEIEAWFWEDQFTVYAQWRRDWVAAYHRDGGCMMLTGFPMVGPHKKNDITNYVIQGPAFHCMLWSLPRIVDCLRRYRMRTRVIGEIHDSVQFDADPRERDDVIDMAVRIMTEDIRDAFRWLNIPLVAEAEACPIDAPWFDKAVLVAGGNGWVPAKLDVWEKKYGSWDKQIVG